MTQGARRSRLVEVDVLRDLMECLLKAAGCGAQVASQVARVFLEADIRGVGLQGLDHMPTMIRGLRTGRINPAGDPFVIKETDASALIDGDVHPYSNNPHIASHH